MRIVESVKEDRNGIGGLRKMERIGEIIEGAGLERVGEG
jgi:hypothetical protein